MSNHAQMHLLIFTIVVLLLYTIAPVFAAENSQKKKKDITDYSDVDLERLYMEWEKNDQDKLDDDDDDEMSPHKRFPKPLDLKEHEGKSPEDFLKITKKGQTLFMFVNIRDPSSPAKKSRVFTENYTELFRSMLANNHVVAETVIIDDDRAIFMFQDGSQAFEAKDVLLRQKQVTEITLEGRQYAGAGATIKEEL
ncbi:hypothetical protein KIN20_015900 [Parelaphostrongylus tenuis]|uniref:Mesoderm development candidate 2 n=1 Tax=Parelaphostrongylus tenuis TaxID=148309 RepID=A0AAD5N4P8_PARTN|nr:hypothetical protein KIN20_015900 [Parelaphostrongylus tenuis]